ncbi:MAG: NUDIX hydrolase [Pirellulales bacterium]
MNDQTKAQPPNLALPFRLGHTTIYREFGKVVCRETFPEPFGSLSEWLLFGATQVPVVVLPLDLEGNVIALEHFRYGAGEMVLELSGGSIEKGQTAKDAVKKELEEEAGFVVCNDDKIVELSPHGLWFDPASSKVQFRPFIAKACTEDKSKRKCDVHEHINVQRITLQKWYNELITIRDTKSIAVSILAIPFLEPEARQTVLKALGDSVAL